MNLFVFLMFLFTFLAGATAGAWLNGLTQAPRRVAWAPTRRK